MGQTYVNDTCKSFDKYQGKRKPRCNGGRGCHACWYVYNHVQQGNNAAWAKFEWTIRN